MFAYVLVGVSPFGPSEVCLRYPARDVADDLCQERRPLMTDHLAVGDFQRGQLPLNQVGVLPFLLLPLHFLGGEEGVVVGLPLDDTGIVVKEADPAPGVTEDRVLVVGLALKFVDRAWTAHELRDLAAIDSFLGKLVGQSLFP